MTQAVILNQAAPQTEVEAGAFFFEPDWEFELNTLEDQSHASLLAHLEKAPEGNETAAYLRACLAEGKGIHFTPFTD